MRAAGQFLADKEFGVAVVVVSAGMTGDEQKDLVLTQARAMVVRDYLVNNFSFDDSQLKTLGRGKGQGDTPDSGWGTVEIIVYPGGRRSSNANQRRQSQSEVDYKNRSVANSSNARTSLSRSPKFHE